MSVANCFRDRYGVPHIFSSTEVGALQAFGFAQAEDRTDTLFAHYLAARGEAASVLGAECLERDITVRAFRLPELAREKYDELPPVVREGVEAFARGVNYYRAMNPARCPAWAFMVDPVDVVSLALLFNLLFATDPAEKHPAQRGSNGFAVAGSRTASGNAIVSLDPHLPLDGALRWYEGRVSGGDLNMYGVAFVGVPYMAMGTNGKIAWGNTVNAPDLSDWYEVRVRQENGTPVYEWDGETRPCDVQTYTFPVRGGEPVKKTILSTHYAPILKTENGKHYACRKANVGDVQVLAQVRAQCVAQNVDEYRAALAGCHTVMFNHLFGDSEGNIGYVSAGAVPRRPEGYDFSDVVPGWTSATQWSDHLTIDELPQAIRPASGFVQNCNDSPAYCGADADDMPVLPPYPKWLAPELGTLRGDWMLDLLRDAPLLTSQSAMKIATDCFDLNAVRELEPLLDSCMAVSPVSSLNVIEKCTKILRNWFDEQDCKLLAEAKGAALFQAWLLQPFVRERIPVGGYWTREQWNQKPLVERFPAECAAALVDAAEWLALYGFAPDVAWGELHRLRRGDIDLPCDGGLDSLVPNGGRVDEATGITTVSFGSSFRAVVELIPGGDPEIWACAPWGNSDDPESPHFADQLPLAARREYRRVAWRWGQNDAD